MSTTTTNRRPRSAHRPHKGHRRHTGLVPVVSRGERDAHASGGAPPAVARPTPARGGTAPREWSDEDLLARMLERDGTAWREFHRRYDRLIYRCIHKVTGRFRSVISSEDIREIYAMFLMNLTARDMHKLRCFAPERGNKFGSWVGLLATNTAWDYLRTLARQPTCTELAEAESIGSSQPDPFDRLVDRERWNLVAETLQSFSSKDRRFVHLYYVDGRTPEEIAELMRISIKTVYSKKHKIRCRLERALHERVAVAA